MGDTNSLQPDEGEGLAASFRSGTLARRNHFCFRGAAGTERRLEPIANDPKATTIIMVASPAARRSPPTNSMVEIGAGSVDRRLDHDELGDRIDANVLPLVTDQRELTPVAGKEPEQIAIVEQLCGFPGNRQASGAFNNAIGRLRGHQTTKKYTRWLMIS